MDYIEHVRNRLSGLEPDVPFWLGGKQAVRDFAKYVGVRTPDVYYRGPLPGLAELPSKPFVLKPEFASTSIGVLLLEPSRDRMYRNIVSGEEMNARDIIDSCREVAFRLRGEDGPNSALFVAEELLYAPDGSTPPPDIRCYAFQGEIGLILMEHHISGPAEAMYFDGNFQPVTDVRDKYGVAPGVTHLESIVDAIPPSNAADILKVARRISVAVPSAFCRIDLYDASGGVTLGELTFTPGTFYYANRKLMSPQESVRLGKLWDDAFDRL